MYEFEHNAMNSPMLAQICCDDKTLAYSASVNCFERVDYIENLLSLYITDSEIDILNNMPSGKVFKLAEDTANCLITACNIAAITDGAVDVCMGDYFLRNKNDAKFGGKQNPQRAKFEIDYDNLLIKKLSSGSIDLGAIGKGFAVDEAVKLLRNPWEIEGAFISFTSSIYALGRNFNGEKWRVNLGKGVSVALENYAVGCSGTAIQGVHICDGRTGEALKNPPLRVWAFAPEAAVCDALSTAFMILEREKIESICNKFNFSAAIEKDENSAIEFIGKLPE